MFDPAFLGDLLMLGFVVGIWALAIWFVAVAVEAVRKTIRGY